MVNTQYIGMPMQGRVVKHYNRLCVLANAIEEHSVGRRAMEMKVQGRRKRGRPKRRWLYNVKDDITEKGLSADDVFDRATWRRMSSYIDPTSRGNKKKRKKKQSHHNVWHIEICAILNCQTAFVNTTIFHVKKYKPK